MTSRPSAARPSIRHALVRRRDRAGPGDLRVRLGAVLPGPPAPGDPDSEWRTWKADLPAVSAAIDALVDTLELEERSGDGQLYWHHEAALLELSIDVTALARDDAIAVGVSIRPVGNKRSRLRGLVRKVLLSGAVVTAALLFIALFLVGAGDARVLILIGLTDLIFTLGAVFWLVVLPERRLALAQAELDRRWRQNFWAALDARLSPRALYR